MSRCRSSEKMSDYLMRGAISNAVNFPSITAEEAPRLKPFIGSPKRSAPSPAMTDAPIAKSHHYEGTVAN